MLQQTFPDDIDPVLGHARAAGERRACVDLGRGETVDYAGLDLLIARCAGLLRILLPNPVGERVATLTRNGLDAVILMIACERVGAIFTPLNWRLAAPELAELVRDCRPSLAVYETEFASAAVAAFGATPTLVISPERNAFREAVHASAPATPTPARPEDPAIILYTSGTTGRSKGVVLSRAAVWWGAANFAAVAEVDSGSTMLCDAPMFHTVGLVATARCALQQGACLVISDRFVPSLALERLADPALGVTHVFGVPQIAQMLCDDPTYDPAKLARLRGLFVGGAPLPGALCHRLLGDGVLVVNGYGMTETSTISGMPLDAANVGARPDAAGYVAPAVELRIADAEGRVVTDGGVGEIQVRGPAVTSGYWGQPEATASAFRDGWFRTGDAGRMDGEGYLFIVDRWKDMYISGGENVYPAEVEAVIATLDGIKEVGVVGVPDKRWGEVGLAFVAAPGVRLTEAEVLSHCAARLATYKRPVGVVFVDALPRTGSGKVRKDELRRMAPQ